LNVVMLVVDMF